jgi:hypothetical protein
MSQESFSGVDSSTCTEPCPLTTVPYFLSVKVLTRLGELPIEGVKLTVDGESWGASSKDGSFGTKNTRDKKSVLLELTYENHSENLKKETFKLRLEEIDPLSSVPPSKATLTNSIEELGDVKVSKSRPQPPVETVFTDPMGVYHQNLFSAFWGKDVTLEVTVKLATFSLRVPYYNQRVRNEPVKTANEDPEGGGHLIQNCLGDHLCFPSSVMMLLRFWGNNAVKRDQVLQKCYDLWAKGTQPNFIIWQDKRLDQWDEFCFVSKEEPRIASGAPNAPAEVKLNEFKKRYWLQLVSNEERVTGCQMMRIEKLFWEDLDCTETSVKDEKAPDVQLGKFWYSNFKNQLFEGVKTGDKAKWEPRAIGFETDEAQPQKWIGSGVIWKKKDKPVIKRAKVKWEAIQECDWRIYTVPAAFDSNKKPSDEGGKGTAFWLQQYWETLAMSEFAKELKDEKGSPVNASNAGEDCLGKHIGWLTEPTAEEKQAKPTAVSSVLDSYKSFLKQGWPLILGTNATGGHMMVARGAVVDQDLKIVWLIINDPFGRLCSEDASDKGWDKTNGTAEQDGVGKHVYYKNSTRGMEKCLNVKENHGLPRLTGDWGERIPLVPGEG